MKPLSEPAYERGEAVKLGPVVLYWRRVIGTVSEGHPTPLLVRYVLLRWPRFGVFVHKLCRSDHDRALHDHPWSFVSVVLWGGYHEVTETAAGWTVMRWRGVGSVAYRPARWRHRVVIASDRPAWTLVFVSRRSRVWGFWPSGRFCRWFRYNPATGICEE